MKKRWYVFLLFLLAALCAFGCRKGDKQAPADYVLYFQADMEAGHGSALETQPYEGTDGAVPSPERLVRALLAGPAEERLKTPFPKGVSLLECEWEQESGTVRLLLSEQYGALTDISLTLADYCLVLTLSQLEGVETVEIATDGHTFSYRSHSALSAEEALLVDALAAGEGAA